jgi:UDP-N-acetylmuramoyl-tripeptide--D-alanyl-D-alanine ligase
MMAVTTFGWHRLLSYLRYFQQEEYNEGRFRNWMREKRAHDRRGTAICIVAAGLSPFLTSATPAFIVATVAAAALLVVAFVVEDDPRKSGKLKLNMTVRASKIFLVGFVLFAAAALVVALTSCVLAPDAWSGLLMAALASALLVRIPQECLLVANRLLWPAEQRLQEHYKRDAQRILREVHPFVIGITGSYGKTGAKAALGDVLTQTLGPTFWPRRSINTVMGITRDIRDNMRPFHRYAVIEMGAYKIGSIKTLCDFTPPKAAIVTAVGIMHLERFGSPDNVYKAKSELPQAVPPDGILVLNGDNPGARRMATDYPKATTILYGLDPSLGHLDCHASDIVFDGNGTRFMLHWKGKAYPARTPLLGGPALSNALGAFSMACALGSDPAYAAACLANLEPVDNRLVLDRRGSVAFLRDAYNSNPTGFAAALEVLKALEAKRRILMTPGMVELGDLQFEENRIVAKHAATVADLTIIVGKENREAFLTGLREVNYPAEKTIIVDTRDEGFKRLSEIQTAGDIILLENDLGDLLEGRVRF